MYRSLLRREFSRAQVVVPESIQDKLERYCEMVGHWNRRINLTGLHGEELVRRLVVEPVWIAYRLKMAGVLLDIGSGNGSPAIPIALVQGMELTQLVESRAKRVVFLREVIASLEMKEVVVHKGRFEEVAAGLQAADWITLQAVTPDEGILGKCRTVSHATTEIVWITSAAAGLLRQAKDRIKVPFSETEAVILRLDPI